MASILFISATDFTHQPRIYKAANYLNSMRHQVYIYTPINFDLTEKSANKMAERGIKFVTCDFRKDKIRGYFNWLYVSTFHFIIKKLRLNLFENFLFNKYLIKSKKIFQINFDVIVVNTIDALPIAYRLKKNSPNSFLIYDSQEYFKGQFRKASQFEYDWVAKNESKYINYCNLILATTNVMREKLLKEYNLNVPIYRVRNTPSLKEFDNKSDVKYPNKTLNVIWAGVTINYRSERGIHIILEAFKYVNNDIRLTLQGNIKTDQKKLVEEFLSINNLSDRIKIVGPSSPENYLMSLTKYDIGVLGEIAENENQLLTSSNKLFYYIAAGLAVVGPNLPGILETLMEYEVGLIYESGNSKDLANKLNTLSQDPNYLYKIKLNSHDLFNNELNWENDYLRIHNFINKL